MRDKANDLVNIYSDDLEPVYVDEIVQFSAFWNRYISSDSSKTEDTKQIRDFQRFKLITRNALDTTFPNMLITLQIYLSLMVTNCSGERSFSTLKRTKDGVRSTMDQNRLNVLSLLRIENELLQEIDVQSAIRDFACRKARQCFFCFTYGMPVRLWVEKSKQLVVKEKQSAVESFRRQVAPFVDVVALCATQELAMIKVDPITRLLEAMWK
ncbi:hypothetical protein LOD99_10906 [Oopsacas minuta]|uniref:HAT C-terminal dimerisation domain-containing protein n=1 Tax=Oopsacas minuta TaxID=111878 RepID=A0AAV7KDF5_9METZ|nr:hypothetical protein LOD99_10906 [Oopsacas minuta]